MSIVSLTTFPLGLFAVTFEFHVLIFSLLLKTICFQDKRREIGFYVLRKMAKTKKVWLRMIRLND